MSSPARRHQTRVRAEQAAGRADAGQQVQGSAYELMLAQLHAHRRSLKAIQSLERKIEAKRSMLADFDAWIDGALAADQGGQDLILASLMVWHLDTGSWQRGLQIARHVLQHGLTLPDHYQRNPATLLIDETASAALNGKLAGDQALDVLGQVGALTAGHDAPDQARAKLHKALGYAVMGKTPTHEPDVATLTPGQAQAAMEQLHRAHILFANVGVKKDMERLERRLKAALGPD